ncbi:MAG: IS4 family transposase, partial [Planctomycetes bacterium]|nr:IS4 family transposase [Planctomycetota bacterium]
MSDDRIHYEDILSSHYDSTLERINKEPVVILSQDTSKLIHMVNKGPKELGTLKNMEKDEVMLHPTIALTPERVCLGVVQAD